MKLTFKEFLTWQKYMHYLLLAGAVFYIHYLTGVWKIEEYAIAHKYIGMTALFLTYATGLLISDTILHLTLGIFQKDDTINYNRGTK